MDDIFRERFTTHYIVLPNGCWKWTSTTLPSGYGVITILNTRYYAHRLAWVLHRGEIPKGVFVCHVCDDRACVNPDHLVLGNRGIKVARGEKSGNAKLRGNDVVRIREGFLRGVTPTELAREHGVSRSNVYAIVHGETWRHVGGPLVTGRIEYIPMGNARLTPDQAMDIYTRYESGEATQRALADEYGLHFTHVSRICSGERWGHITCPGS